MWNPKIPHPLKRLLPLAGGEFVFRARRFVVAMNAAVVASVSKRIHLRVEQDGSGTLLVNASRIYHFNPSASLMARGLLEGLEEKQIIHSLRSAFSVKTSRAAADFTDFKAKLELIASPEEDPCPICDLEVDTLTPFSSRPSAPYRMDLALTYRCNNACHHSK